MTPIKVFIIPDKFKGTLTANEAASAIATGWNRVRPEDQITISPMSDGGDGFGSILGDLLNLEQKTSNTVDAANRPITSQWWHDKKKDSAIIESAKFIGLAHLPPNRFHPFDLDTRGLAQVFHDLVGQGVEEVIVGIGGSATNDGGFGFARALGWQFVAAKGQEITSWTQLHTLQSVFPPKNPIHLKVRVAVDVQNPLLGDTGATRIYGPQKGLKDSDQTKAEQNLSRLAAVISQSNGKNYHDEPGSGAAGGLGFGLLTFMNGILESGFEIYAETINLDDRLKETDLVISAEGSIDEQTLMGKGVGEVLTRCNERDVPCLGIAGSLPNAEFAARAKDYFSSIYGLHPNITTLEEALRSPQHYLVECAALAAQEWSSNN